MLSLSILAIHSYYIFIENTDQARKVTYTAGLDREKEKHGRRLFLKINLISFILTCWYVFKFLSFWGIALENIIRLEL